MTTKRQKPPSTADSDVHPLKPAPPASNVDPDRPAPSADAGVLARLQEENAALRSQNDTILDALMTMQEELATLKGAQTGASATVVQESDTRAQLDAELEQLSKEFADYPLIELFERRALVGLDANLDIRLKDDASVLEDPQGVTCTWKLRWFNFGKEGRASQAGAEGYLKVRWDDLADQEAVATGARIDEYVRKGDRGYEVLHKIPRKLYEYKKRRDAAREAGLLSSASQLRDRVANRVAALAGAVGGNADQAGSFIAGKTFSVEITPGQPETFTP